MDAKELRIGNYFIDIIGGGWCNANELQQVESIGHYGVNNWQDMGASGCCKFDKMKPIPLTEQWLSDFGFIKKDYVGKWGYVYYYSHNDYNYVIEKDFTPRSHWVGIEHTDCPNPEDDYKPINFVYGIFYVHQLQNLFFILLGEELVCKSK